MRSACAFLAMVKITSIKGADTSSRKSLLLLLLGSGLTLVLSLILAIGSVCTLATRIGERVGEGGVGGQNCDCAVVAGLRVETGVLVSILISGEELTGRGGGSGKGGGGGMKSSEESSRLSKRL